MFFIFLFLPLFIVGQEKIKKNMWLSADSAIAAYDSDSFLYYYPKFFHDRDKDPADGKIKKIAPALYNAVAEMNTVNGRRFVVLPQNTMLRWENNVPYAHDACGNKILYFSYLHKKEIETKKEERVISSNPYKKSILELETRIKILEGKIKKQPSRSPFPPEREEKSRFPYWKVGVVGIIVVAVVYILWPRNSPPRVIAGPSGPGVVTN